MTEYLNKVSNPHRRNLNLLTFLPLLRAIFPKEQDKYSCKSIDVPFYLVCPDLDKMIVIQPNEVDA